MIWQDNIRKNMKEYKIVHREELVGYFYVEAESKEEALQEYHRQASEGQIDFSDLELVDGEDIAEELEEDTNEDQNSSD